METNEDPILDIRKAIAETLNGISIPRKAIAETLSIRGTTIPPGCAVKELTDEIIDRLPDFFRQPLQAAPEEPEEPEEPEKLTATILDCKVWDIVDPSIDMAACSALTREIDKGWFLYRIYTLPSHRGDGLASQLVDKICKTADNLKLRVFVDPKPFDYSGEQPPLDNEALRCWYRVRFGFNHQLGRKAMVRLPR